MIPEKNFFLPETKPVLCNKQQCEPFMYMYLTAFGYSSYYTLIEFPRTLTCSEKNRSSAVPEICDYRG